MSCTYLQYLFLTLAVLFNDLAFHSGTHLHASSVYSSFRLANPYGWYLNGVLSLVLNLIQIDDECVLASPSQCFDGPFAYLRTFPNNIPALACWLWILILFGLFTLSISTPNGLPGPRTCPCSCACYHVLHLCSKCYFTIYVRTFHTFFLMFDGPIYWPFLSFRVSPVFSP